MSEPIHTPAGDARLPQELTPAQADALTAAFTTPRDLRGDRRAIFILVAARILAERITIHCPPGAGTDAALRHLGAALDAACWQLRTGGSA